MADVKSVALCRCGNKAKSGLCCKGCNTTYHPSCFNKYFRNGVCCENSLISNNQEIIEPNCDKVTPAMELLNVETLSQIMTEIIKKETMGLRQEIASLKQIIFELKNSNDELYKKTCSCSNNNNVSSVDKVKNNETFADKANSEKINLNKEVNNNRVNDNVKSIQRITQVENVNENKESNKKLQLDNKTQKISNNNKERIESNKNSNKNKQITLEDVRAGIELVTVENYQKTNPKKTNENENDNLGWMPVERKNKRPRNRKSNVTYGQSESDDIKGVPRSGYLHAYRFHPSVTKDQVTAYLNNKGFQHVICESLQSKHPEIYASFKITVNLAQMDELLDARVWPTGVCVNRFFRFNEKRESRT